MKLTTITDLDQPQQVKAPFIERAKLLSSYYEQWKQQFEGDLKYEVDIRGSRGRSGGIHASEISRCRRLVVYSIQNVERRPPQDSTADTNMKMRFSIGHAVHAMLQAEFKKMCEWLNQNGKVLTFEDEVRISPKLEGVAAEWDLHSSCDGVFTFWAPYPDGDRISHAPYLRIGCEIKTASPGEYGKLNKPKEEHKEQTCFYQAALDLPLMWVLYYNKGNCNFTGTAPPFLFQFDKDLWERKLETRFAKAHHEAETNKLPSREEGRHCRWCPFAWTCQPLTLRSGGGRSLSSVARSPGALRLPGK